MLRGKALALVLGPVAFTVAILLSWFVTTQYTSQTVIIGILVWMLVWWIAQPVPIGVTSLLPMVLFPLTDLLSLKETTTNYASPIIYLFFGGFVLGIALQKWNLHKRIALNILKRSGEKPQHIILGSMIATAFMSMWISNTATTVMMLPIGMSLISIVQRRIDAETSSQHFGLALMLGIAYAANLGGISTLIGTPPNLVLASFVAESGLPEFGFSNWMIFAIPLVITLFTIVYLLNTKLLFPIKKGNVSGIASHIQQEIKQLGKLSDAEKKVLIVLVSTALLWTTRTQLSQFGALKNLSDPLIAVLAAIILFMIPVKAEKTTQLMEWKDMDKMPWGILLLFGGGSALAKGMVASDLISLIGDWISNVEYSYPLLLIGVITFLSLTLTEVMSNVALVSVFVPLSFVTAQSLGFSEIQLAIPLTIASSCAFMFPISTPPNAIVFGSGLIQMKQMAKAGIWLNLISIIIITIYCYYLVPVIF